MMGENEESANNQTHRCHSTLISGDLNPHYLPDDVIAEILVRLPAKHLLEFKCVAKSWLSIISSPKFIKKHANRSALDPSLANYSLVLEISYDQIHDEIKPDSSITSPVADLFTDLLENPNPNDLPPRWEIRIMGSFDGLLCVSVYQGSVSHIFLWNPCLRTSKKLPPFSAPGEEEVTPLTYGLGYDEPNDDYNVLGLFLHLSEDYKLVHCVVRIYSLRNDSWKVIEGFRGNLQRNAPVVFANGKFHVLASIWVDSPMAPISILSIDLESKVYGTVEQPNYDNYWSDMSIGVLRGCISVLYSVEEMSCADFWVLKEYGVEESWTKLVNIPYSDGHELWLPSYRMCILLDGKYLLGCGRQLVVYDRQDDSFSYPEKCALVDEICSTAVYVESLVELLFQN